MPEGRLIRQAVVGIAASGPPYPVGSLLMDCADAPIENISQRATVRLEWTRSVNDIDSMYESPIGALF